MHVVHGGAVGIHQFHAVEVEPVGTALVGDVHRHGHLAVSGQVGHGQVEVADTHAGVVDGASHFAYAERHFGIAEVPPRGRAVVGQRG